MAGGQRRKIHCKCGWTNVGHPSRQDKIYLLHTKVCKEASIDYKPSTDSFNTDNGFNGIIKSKNNNINYTKLIGIGIADNIGEKFELYTKQ